MVPECERRRSEVSGVAVCVLVRFGGGGLQALMGRLHSRGLLDGLHADDDRTRDGSVYYPDTVREMARSSTPEDPGLTRLLEQLSERELDVLRALTSGQNNREIAETLFISAETVKSHLSAIIGKLGVRDRTQAAILAIRHGGELVLPS